MTRRLPFLIAFLIALSAAVSCASPGASLVHLGPGKVPRPRAAYPDMFRVAPSYATFGVSRPLQPGEVLRLEVSGLGATRRLRAARCADPSCGTESPAGTWDASSLPAAGEVELTIETPGWYYFWIEDWSGAPGQRAGGPLPESVSWEEQTLTVRYDGGPTVVAEPVQPGAGRSSAPAAAGSAAETADPATLLRRASRLRTEGDLAAAADLFARADRAAGGGAIEAVAGLCRTQLELTRFEAAIAASRRWIELARTPAERADAHHHLGLGLVQHALDELYPNAGLTRRPLGEPGSPRRHADRILGTDRLRRAAEAFRRAVDESGGRAALLELADSLVRLEEYAEASEVLGRGQCLTR